MRLAIVFSLLFATQAVGQQGVRTSDTIYGPAELSELLSGHAVEFFDGAVSRYRADGAYSYKYTENDRPWLGTWTVSENSKGCVAFENGSSRCDPIVPDGTRLVMVIADGTRVPVREHRALVDGN